MTRPKAGGYHERHHLHEAKHHNRLAGACINEAIDRTSDMVVLRALGKAQGALLHQTHHLDELERVRRTQQNADSVQPESAE